MAFASTGYDGTVSEAAWVRHSKHGGSLCGVESGWVVSGVTGTRLLKITIGKGWGWGVEDTTDADETLTLTANSSGSTRWDTLVARRNWTGNATTFVALAGSASKAVSSSLQTAYGTGTGDQPLALIPVANGVTNLAGVAVVPLAGIHSEHIVMPVDAFPHAPAVGQHVSTWTGRQYVWDGAKWKPMTGVTALARGDCSPSGDYPFPSAGWINKVPLSQTTGMTYGGARVEGGKLVAPDTGLYRVKAHQRFSSDRPAMAEVTLSIRAGAGGDSSGGTQVTARWGAVGPSVPNLTLSCDELVWLNAGAYVEVFRSASLSGVIAHQSTSECTASIQLERW